jgi:hypothetical protein
MHVNRTTIARAAWWPLPADTHTRIWAWLTGRRVGRHVLTEYLGRHRAGYHVVVTRPDGVTRDYDVTRSSSPWPRWTAAECAAQGHSPADHTDPAEVMA